MLQSRDADSCTFQHVSKVPLPILGTYIGLLVGAVIGIYLVFDLSMEDNLSILCLVGICLLVGQLTGTSIGAAIGKGSKKAEVEDEDS